MKIKDVEKQMEKLSKLAEHCIIVNVQGRDGVLVFNRSKIDNSVTISISSNAVDFLYFKVDYEVFRDMVVNGLAGKSICANTYEVDREDNLVRKKRQPHRKVCRACKNIFKTYDKDETYCDDCIEEDLEEDLEKDED